MTEKGALDSDKQEFTIGSRIRQIRKSMKMTQKKFAESLGIVQGFLSAIEKDRKYPSVTLLLALEHLYKFNPECVHNGLGENVSDNPGYAISGTENHAVIPLLMNLSEMKDGFQPSARFERFISLPGIPKECFAFEYAGEYMLPTIRDGDIIVIKPENKISSGCIGLIVGKWGEPILRRFREVNGEQFFSSDNTSYSTFKPDASTRILGIVVKIWREIKI